AEYRGKPDVISCARLEDCGRRTASRVLRSRRPLARHGTGHGRPRRVLVDTAVGPEDREGIGDVHVEQLFRLRERVRSGEKPVAFMTFTPRAVFLVVVSLAASGCGRQPVQTVPTATVDTLTFVVGDPSLWPRRGTQFQDQIVDRVRR